MENSTTKRPHFLVRLSSALWRAFRRAPLIMQSLIVATAAGTVLVGVFVGNMGLTLMGTAIGLSGYAVGAVTGFLIVFLPWTTAKAVKNRSPKQ